MERSIAHRGWHEVDELRAMPVTELEDELSGLAAHLSAAEYRWLRMLAIVDEREGYKSWECRGTADWLVRRCGVCRSTAMEKVRVAKAIRSLPVISASFSRGELSYSMVRALTRSATPENESDLVTLARSAPASMIEQLVCKYQRVKKRVTGEALSQSERYFRHYWDDEGSLVFEGRLPATEGALLLQALAAGRDTLNDERHQARKAEKSSAGDSAKESSALDNAEKSSAGDTAFSFSLDEDDDWGRCGTGYYDADRGKWVSDGEFVSTADEIARAAAQEPAKPEIEPTPVAKSKRSRGDLGSTTPDSLSPREDANGFAGAASAADALVAMAHTLLNNGPMALSGGERYLVALHIDAAALVAGDGADDPGDDPTGRCHL